MEPCAVHSMRRTECSEERTEPHGSNDQHNLLRAGLRWYRHIALFSTVWSLLDCAVVGLEIGIVE